uniref:Mini-ribonuclease 3 n=1 Tax=Petrachloros mirabilis TaxID=2918835 RepID=UPI001EE8EBA8|nr:ribonuclease III domain-containing protein [Petrachloros mirabilis]
MPLLPVEVSRLSPSALAYLGDAVYELFIRTQCLFPPSRAANYHQQVVAYVKAETQAYLAQVLHDTLTDTEQQIFRKGRNAAGRGPKRIDLNIYQQATGLETVVGYLYLTDPERLKDLLSQIISQLSCQPVPPAAQQQKAVDVSLPSQP